MAFEGAINAVIGADLSQYNAAMNKVSSIANKTMNDVANILQSGSMSTTQKVGQIMSKLADPMLNSVSKVLPQTVALFEKAGGGIQRVIAGIGEKIPQPIKKGMSAAKNAVVSSAKEMGAGLSQQTSIIGKAFSTDRKSVV